MSILKHVGDVDTEVGDALYAQGKYREYNQWLTEMTAIDYRSGGDDFTLYVTEVKIELWQDWLMPSNEIERIALALESIADSLAGLLESTNPLRPLEQALPENENTVRAFYTDERQQLINEHLRKMGKEPKDL